MTKEEKKTNETKVEKKQAKTIVELEQRIIELETANKEQEEITKKAQYDYINLKMDFERLLKQVEEKEQTMWVDVLIETVGKFLPFVEDIRKSLENIPEETKDTPLAQWVQMIYDKFLSSLDAMKIQPIESIGLEPDSNLHEPVSIIPTEDKKLKWKIIQEFQRGFVYKDGDIIKVIATSKVIIWQ